MPPAIFRAGGGTVDYPRLCLDDELLIDTQTRKQLQQQIARAPHDVEPVGHAQHMNRRFDQRTVDNLFIARPRQAYLEMDEFGI